jgi:predicted outer membrane protein
MKFMHVLVAAAIVALVAPASAASLSKNDATFLTTAIQIQMGRYALASYESAHGSGAAKKFAQTVSAQSTKDSRMLTTLGKRYGVRPPKGLLIQDRYHYSKLQGLSGATLDKAFVRELRISDQINQDTYTEEAQHGRNGTLKTYAKQRYTAVQHELTQLKKL